MENAYKLQVFISYAREDIKRACSIHNRFAEEKLNKWMDTSELKLGTMDWEEAIQSAIEESSIVVLLVSPASARSEYVAHEVSLAMRLNKTILPAWIAGDNWKACVNDEMKNAQYVDCRGSNHWAGIDRLITAVKEDFSDRFPAHEAHPLHTSGMDQESIFYRSRWWQYEQIYGQLAFYVVISQKNQLVTFNSSKYHDMSSFANDLYMNYLTGLYPAFSYGRDWFLAGLASPRVAIPWEWFLINHSPRGSDLTPMTNIDFRWSEKTRLNSLGISEGSVWTVISPAKISPFGVATNDAELVNYLTHADGENYYISMYLDRDYDNRFRVAEPWEVGDFSYKLVCTISHLSNATHFRRRFESIVFVDTKNPPTSANLQHPDASDSARRPG